MWQVIFSTYHKNRIGILRAVPWSFMVSRVITGVTQIIFPYFVYRYFMHGNLNNEFSKYVNGADYITYIVLGSALNVLAVATLMNIGRALITELREGTLEMLLLSPAPRSEYFLGCLLEQTTRAFLEFGTVLIVGVLFGAKLSNFLSTRALITILLAILSFFLYGNFIIFRYAIYKRHLSDTENIICYNEPGMRDYLSDSISAGLGSECSTDFSIDSSSYFISKCGDRT